LETYTKLPEDFSKHTWAVMVCGAVKSGKSLVAQQVLDKWNSDMVICIGEQPGINSTLTIDGNRPSNIIPVLKNHAALLRKDASMGASMTLVISGPDFQYFKRVFKIPPIKDVIRNGRQMNIRVLFICQTPMQLHPWTRDNLDAFFTMRTENQQSMDVCWSITSGITKAEFCRNLHYLPPYCALSCVGGNQFSLLKPPSNQPSTTDKCLDSLDQKIRDNYPSITNVIHLQTEQLLDKMDLMEELACIKMENLEYERMEEMKYDDKKRASKDLKRKRSSEMEQSQVEDEAISSPTTKRRVSADGDVEIVAAATTTTARSASASAAALI